MHLEYIQGDGAQSSLKRIKQIDIVCTIIGVLISILFIVVAIYLKDWKKIVFLLGILIVSTEVVSKKIIGHKNDIISETLATENDLDQYENICIYGVNLTARCPARGRSYQHAVVKLADIYVRKGDFQRAEGLLALLEEQKLNAEVKAVIIKLNATLFFFQGKYGELKESIKVFRKMAPLLSDEFRRKISIQLDIYEGIIDNDMTKVFDICAALEGSPSKMEQTASEYYKGLIKENNGISGYLRHYELAAQGINGLHITRLAREKINNLQHQ